MKTAPDVSRRKNNVLVSQKEKTSQKSSLKKRISTRNGKQCGSTVETSTSTTSSSRNCSAISVDKSVISDRENCGACRSNDVILDPSKKISNFVKSNHKTIFNTSSENIFSRNNDLAKHESRTLGRRNLGDGEKPVDVTDWRLAIDNIELWRNVQEIPSDPHETCEGNFSPRRLDSSFDSIDSSIKSDSGTLDTKTLIRTFSGRFQGRSSQSKKKKKINFVPHNLSSIISDDSKSSQKMGSSDSMENNFLTKMKYHFLDSISHLDASDNLVSSDLSDCRGNKLPQINHITSMKRSEKMQRISQPVTSAMERIYSLRFKINSHKNSNNGALHESCDSGSTLISGSTLVSDDSSIVSLRKSAFNMPKRERIGMLTPPWKTIQSELASHISHETSVNTRTNLPVTSSILCHQNNCSLSSSTVSKENRTHGYVYKESEKGNTLYDLSALYRHPITPHSLGSTILNNSDSDANDDSSGEISENQGSTVSSLSMSTKSLALSSVSMSFSLSANDRPSQYLRSTRSATKYSSELDSVIILVMNPRIPNNQRFNKFMEVQKFELLMVSFNNAVAVMRDLLLQVRPSVTDKSLQMQTYVGLCRPIDDRRRGARCTEKMINYFPTESYKIDPGEILIAIPQCLDATMCAELAQPILDDPSVVSIVDQIRNNPTKDPTPITPNEGVCSQPNLLKNSEVSTHSQRTAISSCSSQSLTKKKSFIESTENTEILFCTTPKQLFGIENDDHALSIGHAMKEKFEITIKVMTSYRLHFLLCTMALYLYILHNQISSPLIPGDTFRSGEIRSKCGLLSFFPKAIHNCRSQTLWMMSDDVLGLYDSGPVFLKDLVWVMRRSETQRNEVDRRIKMSVCTVDQIGRILIDGEEASVERLPNTPLIFVTPWPFIIEPPKWRKMMTELGV